MFPTKNPGLYMNNPDTKRKLHFTLLTEAADFKRIHLTGTKRINTSILMILLFKAKTTAQDI